jgi:phosphatidylserine/phosphatidylglycerophosphate/cardiolipin synthase-like enzyme
MADAIDYQSRDWWADGDTPVRHDSRVMYFVDGRSVLLEMTRSFLQAKSYIYLGNWGMTPKMPMVRGKDQKREGNEQGGREALIEHLHIAGLNEEEIQFWLTHELSLQEVLGYAVRRGVEVKVLLWKSSEAFSNSDPKKAYEELKEVGVECILDESAQGILHHPIESLHQKITIIDGNVAYVGGIDPLIEKKGDFDRWDTPDHVFADPCRSTPSATIPHPWHDAHARVDGPAAADVETNFRQRWNDVIVHHHHKDAQPIPEHSLPEPIESKSLVQIVRTIPQHTYRFEPRVVQGITKIYANAFHNIRQFAYLENQYLWLHAYSGIDIPFMGNDSPEMEQNLRELGAALRRGATVALVLPDHPNVGRAFSDAGVQRLRDEASEADEEGRLQVFCLATSTKQDGQEHYRPIYVHAKVAIVDDGWSTVGSGNLNNRGMRDDTEMNVATLDPELTRGLRLMLQAEHLGLLGADDLFILSRLLGKQGQTQAEHAHAMQTVAILEEKLGDPLAAIKMMHDSAWANLERYKAGQPLVGHLLPYFTADEAIQQGLDFQEEHGWVEEVDKSEKHPI